MGERRGGVGGTQPEPGATARLADERGGGGGRTVAGEDDPPGLALAQRIVGALHQDAKPHGGRLRRVEQQRGRVGPQGIGVERLDCRRSLLAGRVEPVRRVGAGRFAEPAQERREAQDVAAAAGEPDGALRLEEGGDAAAGHAHGSAISSV